MEGQRRLPKWQRRESTANEGGRPRRIAIWADVLVPEIPVGAASAIGRDLRCAA
jgi:hypothetical protein